MSDYRGASIALEAIDIQNGAFFKDLTGIFAQAQVGRLPKKDLQTKMSEEVAAAITKHTGLSTKIQFSHQGTCIWVPQVDRNSALIHQYREFYSSEDGLKMIEAGKGLSSGQINLAKSRVSGDFSKYQATINVDLGHFISGFTPEEVAAVVLHEVGHFFTFLETLDQTCSTNLVLAGLDRELRGGDPKKREYALRKAGDALGLTKEVVQSAVESSNDKVVMTIYVSETMASLRSQGGHQFYDMNSFEMLSDQFAARHGAGRHLVIALDKIYSQYGLQVRMTKVTYLLMQVISVVGLLGTIALSVAAFTSVVAVGPHAIAVGLLLAYLAWSMVTLDHMQGGVPTYDKPYDRAMRVRRQLIQGAKNPRLPKEVATALIEDIKIIDETIAMYSREERWIEKAANYMFKSHRDRRDSVNLQKDLEGLALNDLFLKSLELKHA